MKYPLKKVYVYPITARGTDDSRNPYIWNLTSSLERYFHVVNKNKPSNSGIVQCFTSFFIIDIFMFNWIENLPDRKAGKLQVFILFILFRLAKIFKKKLIWVMHNKLSHSKTNIKEKRRIFKRLLKDSDLIITHSKEGIRFARELYPAFDVSRIKFIHHPVSGQININVNQEQSTPKKFDLLIWGTMAPYKGVDAFLKFLKDKGITGKYSILIIGKFSSNEYYNKTRNLASPGIKIENRFAEEGELVELLSCSAYVLFPYDNASILSSGALMDTLELKANIIGPNSGAFADLASEGLIQVFDTYGDIVKILEQPPTEPEVENRKLAISDFINRNNWDSFGEKMARLIGVCP